MTKKKITVKICPEKSIYRFKGQHLETFKHFLLLSKLEGELRATAETFRVWRSAPYESLTIREQLGEYEFSSYADPASLAHEFESRYATAEVLALQEKLVDMGETGDASLFEHAFVPVGLSDEALVGAALLRKRR
jgi:hypothetical protein